MIVHFLEDYLDVAIFSLVGLGFVSITLTMSRLVAPLEPNEKKLATYECGEVPIGDPWIQFHVRYYIFALIFVIFDIEAVFLYPWGLVFRRLGVFGFVEMMIFIAVLALGLAYAWRKGVLDWV
jgi:NADH:ubiquinone oxidoreductase subunit 3 (subunit A)